jgi:NADPH-dependent 2,4-dienoyl-CoA reductase/sulfur reductase-like enzyme
MHAVVAGAGFVGLEMVEQLMRRGLQVTVVEMLPQVLSPFDVEMAAVIEENLHRRGVTVVTGDGIQEFLPSNSDDKDDPSTVVKLSSGRTLPPAQITILGMGVRPDTKVVRADTLLLTSSCTRTNRMFGRQEMPSKFETQLLAAERSGLFR